MTTQIKIVREDWDRKQILFRLLARLRGAIERLDADEIANIAQRIIANSDSEHVFQADIDHEDGTLHNRDELMKDGLRGEIDWIEAEAATGRWS